MGEGECEPVEAPKKGRHRKKHLYNTILHQMEFYFSDSNLSKDRFLSQLIKQDHFVDLNIFLRFNKIRKLNCTIDDIRKAVSKSELVELSEDKEKIRRKTPVKIKENVDDCTVYVENITADANHESLSQVFSDFGTVLYVSIPKYKHTKNNKGFAFVEFETEKDAENIVTYFESIGCKMPIDTNPEELLSIKTFEDDKILDQMIVSDMKAEIKENEVDNPKKRKLSIEEQNVEKKAKIESCSETDGKQEEQANVDLEDTDSKKKKKHKKDKKKAYIKELGLRVLSKKEWKKLRNRYLDLQKKKMKEFKQYLYNQKSCQKEQNKPEEVVEKLQFIPSVIVKLKLQEPVEDIKKLKNELKSASPDVQYIDAPVGSTEVFARFSNCDGAREFCNQDYPGEKQLLEGDEEKLYWDRLHNQRTAKFAKNIKKQRGRDKLLKKAEKERAKHIKFDEGD